MSCSSLVHITRLLLLLLLDLSVALIGTDVNSDRGTIESFPRTSTHHSLKLRGLRHDLSGA